MKKIVLILIASLSLSFVFSLDADAKFFDKGFFANRAEKKKLKKRVCRIEKIRDAELLAVDNKIKTYQKEIKAVKKACSAGEERDKQVDALRIKIHLLEGEKKSINRFYQKQIDLLIGSL